MSVTLDNKNNKLTFGGDTSIARTAANALTTTGSFKADQLEASGAGVKFPDGTVQTTHAVVPTNISAFANDSGYALSSTLSSVALSGSYNDLSNKPAAYSLPIASGSVLGGVKAGSGVTIGGDGTISASASIGELYLYDTVSRYQVCSITGQAVWVTTSDKVRYGLPWTQSGTSITMTENGHNHIVGDCMIVRGTNLDYQVVNLTSVTTNTFTFTTTTSATASGTAGAYSMGYTFAHNANGSANITGGTLTGPNGYTGVTLLTVHIHLAANTRSSTIYYLVIPIQPAGAQSGNDNVIVPGYNVRQDGTTLSAVGATIGCDISSSWQTYQLGALPASATGMHAQLYF